MKKVFSGITMGMLEPMRPGKPLPAAAKMPAPKKPKTIKRPAGKRRK